MKPAAPVQNCLREQNHPFPITDWNYRLLGTGELNARCAGAQCSSLAKVSHAYLNGEARRNFVTETLLFAIIAAATVPALLDCGRALLAFLRVISGI
jgi:hypothetical protein